MSDVADILGISKNGKDSTIKQSSKPVPKKKPVGMSREVFSLLGQHDLPSIVPTKSDPSGFKEKRQIKAVKWIRKSFTNSARSDGLVLYHWVKAALQTQEYPFARFNIPSKVVEYTDEEYKTIITPTDKETGWNKEETDLLISLCKRYDFRWIVISDRFIQGINKRKTTESNSSTSSISKDSNQSNNSTSPVKTSTSPPKRSPLRSPLRAPFVSSKLYKPNSSYSSSSSRSVDDLKYRYFEVARQILQHRQDKSLSKSDTSTVDDNAKIDENKASSGTTNSLNVVKTEIKLEPGIPKLSTEEEYGIPLDYHFNLEHEKKRKKQLELLFTRSPAEENQIGRLKDELKSIEQQLRKASARTDSKKRKEIMEVALKTDRRIGAGVYLRSTTQILPPQPNTLSSKLIQKMNLILEELKIPLRPIPTSNVCNMYDEVRQGIIKILSVQKALKKKELELHTLQERLKSLQDPTYKPKPMIKNNAASSSTNTSKPKKSANSPVKPPSSSPDKKGSTDSAASSATTTKSTALSNTATAGASNTGATSVVTPSSRDVYTSHRSSIYKRKSPTNNLTSSPVSLKSSTSATSSSSSPVSKRLKKS